MSPDPEAQTEGIEGEGQVGEGQAEEGQAEDKTAPASQEEQFDSDVAQQGRTEDEVDYSKLPPWARPPGYQAGPEVAADQGARPLGEGIEGPGSFVWAQQLGFAFAIIFFATVVLSWAVAMEPSDAPCTGDGPCFRWTRLWLAPAFGLLHAALGALSLAGALALRRGRAGGAWFFLLPDIYLILGGMALSLLGIVYWKFGQGWLLWPGLAMYLGMAHVTFLVHPRTRRYLRRIAPVPAA